MSGFRSLFQAQTRISEAFFAHQGRHLPVDLKVRADATVVGQRALRRYSGARGKGPMAWATRQGVDNRERLAPVAFQEILTCSLGFHDRDIPFGGMCYEGCDTPPSPVHTLTCTRGGLCTAYWLN